MGTVWVKQKKKISEKLSVSVFVNLFTIDISVTWLSAYSGTYNYVQIPLADCPEVVVIRAPFERQHIEVHILERAIFSGFGRWKFTTKEDLNRRKRSFFLF